MWLRNMENFYFKKFGLIAPVYYLSIFCAVSVPYSSSIPKLFRLYALTVAVVFIINACGIELWTAYFRNKLCLVQSTKLISCFYIIISTLLNVIAILKPCFSYSNSYLEILKLFSEIDNCLKNKTIIRDNNVHVRQYVKFIVVYGTFLVTLLFGIILQDNDLYITEYLYLHHIIIEIFVIDNLLVSIKQRYINLNQNLHEVCNNHQERSNKQTVSKYFKMRNILKAYELLINQVNYFNTIFGWQILYFTFLNTACILFNMDLIIKNVVPKTTNEIDTYDLVAFAIRSFLLMLFLIMLAEKCDAICQEADVISQQCDKYFVTFPPLIKTEEEMQLKEQIELLARFKLQVFPKFTAADCFDFNLSALITIFGITTSYVIVLLQL
nr:gustatory receptor 16 [Podabrus annulatus]